MKTTLIAVACAAVISTGAIAKPMQPAQPSHNNSHSVHMVNKHQSPKPAPQAHHNKPAQVVHVAHSRPTPPPPHHHHHHSSFDFGDALIAFAILATAF